MKKYFHPFGLILSFFLLNFLFSPIGGLVHLYRPLFNIDYLIVMVLALFLARKYIIVASVLVFFLDLSFSIAPNYRFHPITFIFILSKAIFSWIPEKLYYFPWIGIALLLLLVLRDKASQPFLPSKNRRLDAYSLMLLALILCILDFSSGANYFSKFHDRPFFNLNIPWNISYSPFFLSVTSLHEKIEIPYEPLNTPVASEILYEALNKKDAHSSQQSIFKTVDKVVFIMVESMGHYLNESMNSAMLSPFDNPALLQRYQKVKGKTSVQGVTVFGEFRDLCHVALQDISFSDAKTFPTCLPSILRANGLETTAIHGFTQNFYSRSRLYPLMGFEKTIFLEDLVKEKDIPYCGNVFRGACDLFIAKEILQPMLSYHNSRKQFIYWLTLNSHMPIYNYSFTHPMGCPLAHSDLSDACIFANTIYDVVYEIAELAIHVDRRQNILFIIAGDHPPHYADKNYKELFDSDIVPVIQLIPKP